MQMHTGNPDPVRLLFIKKEKNDFSGNLKYVIRQKMQCALNACRVSRRNSCDLYCKKNS